MPLCLRSVRSAGKYRALRSVTTVGITYKPTILHYSVRSFYSLFVERVSGFNDDDQHVLPLSSRYG